MSPTGPLYPGTATDAGGGTVAWTTVANSKVEDAAVASCSNIGPGGGGGTPNQLNSTNLGFAIPSTAVIDGIKLEVKVSTSDGGGGSCNDGLGGAGGVYLVYNGGATSYSNTPNSGQFWPSAGLTWLTYGSATSKWGRTWTAADINNSSFGSSISASAGHATSSINVDSVRITVYWHTAPAEVVHRFRYKVFNNGVYLGDLPNVTSDFNPSQDINTGGSQITVTCGVSPDTAILAPNPIIDETGSYVLDETGAIITDEGVVPLAGVGTGGQLMRNGNQVQVVEVGYWYPNGQNAFNGVIQRIEADYGGNGDQVNLTIYSDGSDLDNHLVKGNPYTYTLDQSQTSQNTTDGIFYNNGGKLFDWNFDGQTFKTGSGVTNLGAILIKLNGTATVTITVYDSPALVNTLGSTTQAVSVGSATDIQFNFASPIVVTALTSYFFTVTVAANQSITIYYQNTNVYANGSMYNSFYGGGSGGGSWINTNTSDLYFKTFSGSGSTIATYTTVDPTSGMLTPIMNSYNQESSVIQIGNIQATGITTSYKFNTNTIYEALQATLSLSPYGYYYYVDLGTDLLYFQQASTTADITLVKGFHIDRITVIMTIEQIINKVFFTGGLVSGNTIYTLDQDGTSISLYGTRLDRPTNNAVLDTTSAHAIGSAEVKELKNEQYQTMVTIPYHKLDFSTIHPGTIIGFAGFGSFVDSLLMQVVRRDRTGEELTLTLGIVPKRLHKAVEQVVRGYIGLQTVSNPTSPS